jgi:hypothetical protein
MKLEGDQFSFKKVLFSFFLIIPFVNKNKIIVLFGGLIGLFIGLYIEIYKNSSVAYKSDIVFIMDSEAGASGGALSELASSFGLSGNFGPNNALFSGENFKELLKTKAIFRKALLKKVEWNGKEEIFANLFLKKSRINEFEWSNLPEDFYIHRFKSSEIKDLDVQDRNVLDMIYLHMKEKTFLVSENQKSSFLKLSVETRNDTLSYIWSKLYLKTVADFYIDTKTKKSKELLVIMSSRVDSLRSALYYTQGKLANYQDQNQQIIFQQARIIADRLQMNSTQLQAMYLESVRNLDNLKFSLIKESPLLNIISDTELPLTLAPKSKGTITLLGAILGFFFSCGVVYLINLYKEFISK